MAVLPFEGAPRLQAAVAEKLGQQFQVVPAAEWQAAAQELNATGLSDEDIAKVAGKLKIAAVVTALVRKDPDGVWLVNVAPRHGPSGAAVDTLRYPLKSPYTAKNLLLAIGPAVQAAVQGPPTLALPGGSPSASPPPLPLPPPLPEDTPQPRPRWYPYFDVDVGIVLGGRRFSFDEQSGPKPIHCFDFQQPVQSQANPGQISYQYSATTRCPGYVGNAGPGLRLSAEVNPFAGSPHHWLQGLGVGGLLDLMFWPDGAACDKYVDGGCLVPGTPLSTSEVRLEVGLHWTYNFLNRRSRPSLLLAVQYGLHQFSLQKTVATYEYADPATSNSIKVQGLDDHGLPGISYSYVDLAAGLRVPFYGTKQWYLGMLLGFHYHVMLGYGEIATQFASGSGYSALFQGGGYGPVSSGYGVRAEVTPLELIPWKGLTIRLGGYLEVFGMSYALFVPGDLPPSDVPPAQAARHLAHGATDEYFGGVLQLGYQY